MQGGAAGGSDVDPADRYGVREERLLTGATVITAVRTVASVVLAAMAAHQQLEALAGRARGGRLTDLGVDRLP